MRRPMVLVSVWIQLLLLTTTIAAQESSSATQQDAVASSADATAGGAAETPSESQPAAQSAGTAITKLIQGVQAHPFLTTIAVIASVLFIIGVCVLLYHAAQTPKDPFILRLGPSFFFWLGMVYLAILLLIAIGHQFFKPFDSGLIAGILPVAVPWFGALGAVTISVEGVFYFSTQWDNKFNYWHIGRPLFGAVLGIVAFFIFVLIVTAAGTPPTFLQTGKPLPKDVVVFYVVAFLVGYREETFRELIKRATDLVLQPGAPTSTPAVTLKSDGQVKTKIEFPDTKVGQTTTVNAEVQNSGKTSLASLQVTFTPIAPATGSTFALQTVPTADLGPGAARSIVLTFAPTEAKDYSGTLTISAANLASPLSIPVTGKGVP